MPRAQNEASDPRPQRSSPARLSAPPFAADAYLRPETLHPSRLRRFWRRYGNAKVLYGRLSVHPFFVAHVLAIKSFLRHRAIDLLAGEDAADRALQHRAALTK